MQFNYVVEMTTKPTGYEQYGTVITFTAGNMSDDQAFTKAVKEAREGAFFDYTKSMWNLDKVTKTEA